ncbi:Phage integrase [Pararhodospirillum photometricum DSM 122]|uniref:Phage integrase n=2 Tax=Pararhodospirillum photometricum TaxID=1084 RepID=H6SKU5_PARPM|nr:Phage integrase [Pararhodospirillum photometricum DSM 122]
MSLIKPHRATFALLRRHATIYCYKTLLFHTFYDHDTLPRHQFSSLLLPMRYLHPTFRLRMGDAGGRGSMAKLTKRVVDQIAPGSTESVHWDDELKGFGLRVWPSGRKVYMVMSRVKGRLRRITIGPHGAITPEQARIRAHEILAEAKTGRDPAQELDQARKAPTVKGLGERFLKEHVAVRCKPSTQAEYKRSVELFINPKLGTRKVTDIERRDIAELHQSLSHIPYQANRTLGVLSKMFNLAEVWGLRPDGSNPCLHVKKYVERKRERFLSPAEFAALGTALCEAEADGSETRSAITAIQLLMLTGCRLRW